MMPLLVHVSVPGKMAPYDVNRNARLGWTVLLTTRGIYEGEQSVESIDTLFAFMVAATHDGRGTRHVRRSTRTAMLPAASVTSLNFMP